MKLKVRIQDISFEDLDDIIFKDGEDPDQEEISLEGLEGEND